jgi:hypothetical protein
MMEVFVGALTAVGGGLLFIWRAVWPVLKPALESAARAAAQQALLATQERLVSGASRVAAELAMQARAGGMGKVSEQMLLDGVEEFRKTYAETLEQVQANPSNIIAGELAKLGVSVLRR